MSHDSCSASMTTQLKSRLEVNFIRLIEETQHIANGNKPKDWKFSKFVEWLQEKIPEMEKSPNAPSEERLKHYKRQVEFLKGVHEVDKCEKPVDGLGAIQLLPHGSATTGDQVITQQIHQRSQALSTNKLRKELLGLDSLETDVRSRKPIESILGDSFQDQMCLEERRRDKMVEDMIAMTREWKEQSRVAGKVIQKDVEVIDKSSRLADTNEDQLKIESSRLADFTARTCNCWIWLMLIFICCSFISMVMFIKMFPKKSMNSWL